MGKYCVKQCRDMGAREGGYAHHVVKFFFHEFVLDDVCGLLDVYFVDNQNFGDGCTPHDAKRFILLFGAGSGVVYHIKDHINILTQGFFCAFVDARGKLVFNFAKYARGVDKNNLPAFVFKDRLDAKARGLGFGGGDGHFLPQDGVHEG